MKAMTEACEDAVRGAFAGLLKVADGHHDDVVALAQNVVERAAEHGDHRRSETYRTLAELIVDSDRRLPWGTSTTARRLEALSIVAVYQAGFLVEPKHLLHGKYVELAHASKAIVQHIKTGKLRLGVRSSDTTQKALP